MKQFNLKIFTLLSIFFNIQCSELAQSKMPREIEVDDAIVMLSLLLTDVNAQDDQGRTPLFIAAQYGYARAIDKLIEVASDIDVNKPNNDGITPLAIAAEKGHVQVIKSLFFTNKLNINISDKAGYTSLMRAVQAGHTMIVKMLMVIGENPNLTIKKDDKLISIEDLAPKGNKDIADLIEIAKKKHT